jgi:predicted 2-oxoglutarate/Fe(II)-dependent dioxygenase YbiX
VIQDYILEIRKFFPSSLCEKIISYYDDNNLVDATTVGGMNKEVRNCISKNILQPKSFGQKIVQNIVEEKLWQAMDVYKEKFPYSNISKFSTIDFLKYEHNTYKAGYKFHTDMGATVPLRQLSISVCLNNDFEGGEFVFDFPKNKVQFPQNIGDTIIFPSNFMYPHQVNQITKGTRYALIGWFV